MRGGGWCRNPREGWTRRGSPCAGAHDSAAAGFSEATETTIFKVRSLTEPPAESVEISAVISAKNLAGSVRVVRCGISFGRVGKTRPSVTRLRVELSAPCVRFAGNLCRFEASRERGDLARGAATTPLHATRVRTPRRFSERVTSLARPRHARRVRRAPGAARRRAGSPRGASDRRPQPPSAARRSRTRVAPLGGRARRDDARREHSPARHSAVVVASPARPQVFDRAARRGGHDPQSGLRARRAARRFVRRGGRRFLSTVDRPRNRRRLDDVSETKSRHSRDVELQLRAF